MTDTFMFQVIKVTVICPPLLFISSRYILHITEEQASQEIHYDQKYLLLFMAFLKGLLIPSSRAYRDVH